MVEEEAPHPLVTLNVTVSVKEQALEGVTVVPEKVSVHVNALGAVQPSLATALP